MSHLPLDARAILHYLNELGYRNISATQLKEFLKGMQPKSKSQQQQKLPTTPTTRNTTTGATESASVLQQNTTATTAAATAHEVTRRSSAIKIVKCKKPLCNFKFYLDICDHQLTKRIEEQIKLLGGALDFFLTPSVTHFITDKQNSAATKTTNSSTHNSNNPIISPQTPQTPQTPYSLECSVESTKPNNNALANKKVIRNSRADAILNKARIQSILKVSTRSARQLHPKFSTVEESRCIISPQRKGNSGNHDTGPQALPYVVWQCEYGLRFFKKIQHELRDYLDHSNKPKSKSCAIEPISLKGSFIKFESLKGNFRPYYHLFKKPQEWPKVQLTREDGAFRLSPKKESPIQDLDHFDNFGQTFDGGALADNMTRKSRTKSSQNHHNLKNKGNDLIKSQGNSQKHVDKCKNQTPQQQKDSSDKQCGVCEICKIEYDALTIHLKTKDHEYFAKNSQNFIALDSLIHSSADVNKFLDDNQKLEIKTELEEMEVDHDGLIIIEQDPLENSENENENQNEDDEDDDDEESQKSSSTTKRKSAESKIFSPTLREKSKRSTKGKHSSEKFQNCTPTGKAPKIPSPQKSLSAMTLTRKKIPSTAAISPPIRAMLPPNSMYKVVETRSEVNYASPRGKSLVGLSNGSKGVGSPSLIVKFKKVRTTELQVLNGEAENFMFPKKRNDDSSELPTDVDRQTTSDRVQPTHSSLQILTTSSSSEEHEGDEDFGVRHKSLQVSHNTKRPIVKAKRRLCKINSSSTSKLAIRGKSKQSFPKTPIQPKEQLKSETISTKRKSAPTPRKHFAKPPKVTAVGMVSNKIVLPEATRKSSRTATAIVTAATTSTRLLQAAVDAAKSKHKLETSIKFKLPSPMPPLLQIKQELKTDSEQEEEDGNIVLDNKSKPKRMRCSRKSVVNMEDRMGDNNKKARKFIHGFPAYDYEDEDDITIDDEDDDDDNDEDFIVQTSKGRRRLSSTKLTRKPSNKVSPEFIPIQKTPPASKSLPKDRRSTKKTLPITTIREERLARRQSRIITQLQLELQTGSEEDQVKYFPKPKVTEKKSEKNANENLSSKPASKLSKAVTAAKKFPLKTISTIKQESTPTSAYSRYFDHTKSERLKSMRYAFERLPVSDLWYRVYKRQDNCEEKYFEYFGSTKYRKLPYELGPIPVDSVMFDHNKHKICCKLCEVGRFKSEGEKALKLHVRRDLRLDIKSETTESLNNTNILESLEHHSSSSGHSKNQQQEQTNIILDKDQQHSKLNSCSYNTDPKSYAHKHKKLHLLQRYRQELEEQEQLQRQKLEDQIKISRTDGRLLASTCDIRTDDVPPDCLPCRSDRAGSIHSNASSCASCANTNCKSKKMRNKLLNKVSYLANLELPPRKSPREHASTLALVSCIIKQRQDSLSKPNSETDEPPTPTEAESKVLVLGTEKLNVCEELDKDPPKTPPPSTRKTSADSPNRTSSSRTRSQATTPIEEVRFATEISETVKRMRRGRNKYDYSPPFVQRIVARPSSSRRGRGGSTSAVNLFGSSHKNLTSASSAGSIAQQITHTLNNSNSNSKIHKQPTADAITRGRRKRGRPKGCHNIPKNPENVLTSIRKTGSKKGVLEFDVDNVAIEALKKATAEYHNSKLLEWQVDKFLTMSNREYQQDLLLPSLNVGTTPEYNVDEIGDIHPLDDIVPTISDIVINTPPSTDYFSSDFDLCDIINQSSNRLQEEGDHHLDRNSKKFSIFNTEHLNKYYRKRKNLKTNRTGWPKAPKRKASTRQQSTEDKIYFLNSGNKRDDNFEVKIDCKKEVVGGNRVLDEDDTTQEQTRESGVITPPDSENEEEDNGKQYKMANEEDDSLLMEEESQLDLNEDSLTANDDDDDDNNCNEDEEGEVEECEGIIIDDDETLDDSVDDDEENERIEQKADSDADADVEEADEDEERNTRRDKIPQKCVDTVKKFNKKCKKIIPKIVENDDEDSYEPQEKRQRVLEDSPEEKLRTNLLNPNSGNTTTPSTPFMRALRRTPQLNGSLGSCLSPSEKAGDNSDIFTVSSDGLDTDLDLSNSHSQLRSTINVGIDEDEHHQRHHHNTFLHTNSSTMITPRRKFDISKYAPTNAATCAAEAATAAVKSMAISQFLKKEVRVTCRRLRAPFRRFRYRR